MGSRGCRGGFQTRPQAHGAGRSILAGSHGRREACRDVGGRSARRGHGRRGAGTVATPPLRRPGVRQVDHHRALRQGFPEVIMGEGKEVSDIADIARAIRKRGDNVLITRLSQEKMDSLKTRLRGSATTARPGPATWRAKDAPMKGKGTIAVVCAGTSRHTRGRGSRGDQRDHGQPGGAGLRRGRRRPAPALGPHRQLTEAALLIVVAGMEGALPSVVAGLVPEAGHRRSHQRRLRRQLPRSVGIAGDAELLRRGSHGGEYRQRLRRRLRAR